MATRAAAPKGHGSKGSSNLSLSLVHVCAVLRHGAKKLTSVISCCERNSLKVSAPSFWLSLLSACLGVGVGVGVGVGQQALAQLVAGRRRNIGDFGRASRPQRGLPSGPGRLSGSSRARSAAGSLESQPREARVASCGATKAAL